MMILNTLLLSLAPLAPDAVTEWDAPGFYVPGDSYDVTVTINASEGGEVPAWYLSPAAFELGKKSLGKRGKSSIELAKGAQITLTYDLAPEIKAAGGSADGGPLSLAFAGGAAREIIVLHRITAGLDFMAMDAAELSKYRVLMETTSGDMLMEFWPDLAPGHVRNFLDLSYNPFYAGTVFHRTIPGFMIQGGCPQGNGRGSGPRMLKAEFSDRKHVRGVLSMARSQSPDSASSQFFVCHGDPSSLNGKYTVFGRLVFGYDTLDRIVTAPTKPRSQVDPEGSSPVAPVKVTKTSVLRAN